MNQNRQSKNQEVDKLNLLRLAVIFMICRMLSPTQRRRLFVIMFRLEADVWVAHDI